MNSLITILIQSSLSLSVLFLIYYLFLRKDTFFKTNRIYLLSALLFSLIMPFIDLSFLLQRADGLYMILLDPITITPEGVGASIKTHYDIYTTLLIIYFTGVFIFTIRFIFQIIQLFTLIRKFGISKNEGMRFVFTDKQFSPFSFFNIIFLNNSDIQSKDTRKIITHEMVHIRQWHSIDLIILEIITIIQWFNPFIWMYRHAVKTLHEYLADEGVLHSGVDSKVYSALLFEQSTGIQINDLANNFSKSLLKRRFNMMSKQRTTKLARFKLLLVLPLAFTMMLVLSFSPDVIGQEDKKEIPPPPPKSAEKPDKPIMDKSADYQEEQVFTVVEVMPEFPGGRNAMYAYLGKSIKYPEAAKKNKTQGIVYVTFVVKKDGSVSSVKKIRGIGDGCDKEAVRVIKEMPKWEPGKQGGKAVNVQFNLPIKFNLAEDDNEKEEKK